MDDEEIKNKIHNVNKEIYNIKNENVDHIENIRKLKFYEFEEFNNVSEMIESYLSELTDEIETLLPVDVDMQSIYFLLYEIIINVYKHSKFKNAYVKVDSNKIINILIMDDGIGIPGSFKEASIDFHDDSEAIFEAINGKTTDKEKYNLHGRGLNSTARITTLGFKGEMIVFSGNGICIITKEGIKTCKNDKYINGTMISLKIPNIKTDNIYKYLKHEKINKIKGVDL